VRIGEKCRDVIENAKKRKKRDLKMRDSCARLNIPIKLTHQGTCLKNPKNQICNGCFAHDLLPKGTHRVSSESLYDRCTKLSEQIGGGRKA